MVAAGTNVLQMYKCTNHGSKCCILGSRTAELVVLLILLVHTLGLIPPAGNKVGSMYLLATWQIGFCFLLVKWWPP